MTGNFFLVSLCAFCISLILTPIVRKLSPSLGLMDYPGGRKIHSHPTPSSGGLVLFCAFILPLWFTLNHFNYFFSAPTRMFFGLTSGCLFITLLGILDDRLDLRPHFKLFGQIFAACILFWAGFRIDILTNPIGTPVDLGIWSLLFTVLWVISLVNAINLIDGLDGLAAGVCFFVSITLGTIGWFQNEIEVMILSFILAGALLGILRSNFYPASIFLGDSGSMLCGFSIAAISLMGARKSTTALALLFPLVVGLLVPIVDTLTAIFRRWWSGKPLFLGDKKHLHHRLVHLGIHQKQVVISFYFLTIYLCIVAFSLAIIPVQYSLIILVLLAMGLFFAFRVLFFLESRLLSQEIPAHHAIEQEKPKPTLFFWERFLEEKTEYVLSLILSYRMICVSVLIPLIFCLTILYFLPLPFSILSYVARVDELDILLRSPSAQHEWQAGVAVQIPELLKENVADGQVLIFTSTGEPVPFLPIREGNEINNLWLFYSPLLADDNGKVLFLSSPLFTLAKNPTVFEFAPSPRIQTTGNNVNFWKREVLTQDGRILPARGRYMTRISVQFRKVEGDHFTNDLINYNEFDNLILTESSFLEYAVRLEKIGAAHPEFGVLRCSLQAEIDGQLTDDIVSSDQNFVPGVWNADLSDYAVDKWYFRRIPLGQFAGKRLERLYMMINDFPQLSPNHPLFSPHNDGYFHCYFDAVSITSLK